MVKLYLAGTPLETVKRASDVTREAWQAGLPVPATFDLVEIDGRHGIVFERIDKISMRRHFQLRPWKLFSSARQLVELHSQVHGWKAPKETPRFASGSRSASTQLRPCPSLNAVELDGV